MRCLVCFIVFYCLSTHVVPHASQNHKLNPAFSAPLLPPLPRQPPNLAILSAAARPCPAGWCRAQDGGRGPAPLWASRRAPERSAGPVLPGAPRLPPGSVRGGPAAGMCEATAGEGGRPGRPGAGGAEGVSGETSRGGYFC